MKVTIVQNGLASGKLHQIYRYHTYLKAILVSFVTSFSWTVALLSGMTMIFKKFFPSHMYIVYKKVLMAQKLFSETLFGLVL